MAWNQLEIDNSNVSFACLGFFCILFCLVSRLIKEKFYIGEATLAAIFGLIIGPHALNWVNPYNWGNFNYITLEISRIILCIELVAVGIELPPKYIFRNAYAIFLQLFFSMIIGWLVFAAFIHLILPDYSFTWGLLISACVTATDPVLAQEVIGKSKFAAEFVPTHIRHLITAESGCNDGLAVPFVFLAVDLIIDAGDSHRIAKDFICITVLYQCLFGSIFGFIIGYALSWAFRLSQKLDWINREFKVLFVIMIGLFITGITPLLGVDELLAAFFAGCGFVWDDWLENGELLLEQESFMDSFDCFLNMAYFIYFGASVSWENFNNHLLHLDVWRLILIAIVFLVLRRFPPVLAYYKLSPDIHSFKEAIFVSHFGPIGVSGLFACILAISKLEKFALDTEETPIADITVPNEVPLSHLINTVFPVVSFIVTVSVIVYGLSAPLIVFYKFIKEKYITKSIDNQTSLEMETDIIELNKIHKL